MWTLNHLHLLYIKGCYKKVFSLAFFVEVLS